MLSAEVAHTRAQVADDTQVNAVLLTTGTFPIVDLSLSSEDSQPARTDRRRELRPRAEPA